MPRFHGDHMGLYEYRNPREVLTVTPNGEYGCNLAKFPRRSTIAVGSNRMASIKDFLTFLLTTGSGIFQRTDYRWQDKRLLYRRMDVDFGDASGNVAIACSDIKTTTNDTWQVALVINGDGQYTLGAFATRSGGVTNNELTGVGAEPSIIQPNPLNVLNPQVWSCTVTSGYNTIETVIEITNPQINTGNTYYAATAFDRAYSGANCQHFYVNGTYIGTFPAEWTSVANFPCRHVFWGDCTWSSRKPTGWNDPTGSTATKVKNVESHLTAYDVNGTTSQDPWYITSDAPSIGEPKDIDFSDTSLWKLKIHTNGTATDIPATGSSKKNVSNYSLSTGTTVSNAPTFPTIESRLKSWFFKEAWTDYGQNLSRVEGAIEWRNASVGGSWQSFPIVSDQLVNWDDPTDSTDGFITLDVTDEKSGLSSFELTAFNNLFTGSTIQIELTRS